jgi:hypothetical protein
MISKVGLVSIYGADRDPQYRRRGGGGLARAAASGTSMEEQARRALARAVGLDREAALHRIDEVRGRIGRLNDISILDDLQRDRRRDRS